MSETSIEGRTAEVGGHPAQPPGTALRARHIKRDRLLQMLDNFVDGTYQTIATDVVAEAARHLRVSAAPKDAEIERAMRHAADEIMSMRRRIEVLQAKVDIMDLFNLALTSRPQGGAMGITEDPVWMLQRALRSFGDDKIPSPPPNA